MKIARRTLVATAALTLGVLAAGTAMAQNNVLRVVPHSNLAVLDPIWTTANMSAYHGAMMYDMLFAID